MKLYSDIERAIRIHTSSIQVPDGTSQYEVYQCIRSIMRNNPDIFWFSHQWNYSEDEHAIKFHYTIDKERCITAQEQIEDVVQQDFQIKAVLELSPLKQAMYVYKWLGQYCKYNVFSAFNQTIYSVFVCRNSVCTGIAKAAQYLFLRLGIESKLVFGNLHNSAKGSRHCWLVVKLEGIWYHFDPTFAIPEISDMLIQAGIDPIFGADGLVYNYFCCDTSTIKQSRTIEDEQELADCHTTIDHKTLHKIRTNPHRVIVPEALGERGCLLSQSGSSAEVYLWHSESDQTIVKIYKNDPTHELLKHEYGIMKEMAAAKSVLHVYGMTESLNGLILEQATPLSDLLCSHYYTLSATDFCKLLSDVIEGLSDCLRHGIYYRDIHINNIYRTSEGRYVLGDFGSCKWIGRANPTNQGGIASPWYAAPETMKNGDFDERSATYGIGMLAYFLLNDLFPPLWNEFGSKSLNHRLEGNNLPSPSLLKNPTHIFGQELNAVVQKATSFEPLKRYQTLNEIRIAINHCLNLAEPNDYLLIDGGSSERLYGFDQREPSDKNSHKINHDFHSTCQFHSDILVSNGENYVRDSDLNSITKENANNEGPRHNNDLYAKELEYSNPNRVCFGEDFSDIDFDSPAQSSISPNCSKPFPIYGASSAPPSREFRMEGTLRRNRIDDFATSILPYPFRDRAPETYQPEYKETKSNWSKSEASLWSRIWKKDGKKPQEGTNVYSSVFAPAEVKQKTHMLVQVFLHLYEETEMVKSLAQEAQKDAERRGYIPLQCILKTGDEVTIQLDIYGETLLMTSKEKLIWQGRFTKCTFDYLVPKNLEEDELSCKVTLTINGLPIGEMYFITRIVEKPRQLNTNINVHKYNKVFLSYAHKDEAQVRSFHEGLNLAGIENFFDRTYLKTGDIFPKVIQNYIDSADLFVLFWSENAAESDYVRKERSQALKRAFPQVKPQHEARLTIYPLSIEPRAALPGDMRDYYHFGEI